MLLTHPIQNLSQNHGDVYTAVSTCFAELVGDFAELVGIKSSRSVATESKVCMQAQQLAACAVGLPRSQQLCWLLCQ
jgi:hypothetical protein